MLKRSLILVFATALMVAPAVVQAAGLRSGSQGRMPRSITAITSGGGTKIGDESTVTNIAGDARAL